MVAFFYSKKTFFKKPLIQHTIDFAKKIKLTPYILVTTDDSDILNIAFKNKLLSPWLRPSKISQANSTSYSFMKHAISWFEKTYFKEVFETLKKRFKLGRVRLLLKEPRSTLSWHKDPECRLHVPIITNKGCSMVIENVAKHLPADGKVWVTNNTKYHNFFNGGEQARIHLVACVLESPFKK